MFSKPHYQQIAASDVRPGMRIYSKLLGEAFTVARVEKKGATLFFRDGIFTASVAWRGVVWQETKPRGLE